MMNNVTYSTFEKKVIYAFSVLNESGKLDYYNGLEKIGDTSITSMKADLRDDSKDLQEVARKRIKQYAGTAGLPYKIDVSRLAVRKDNTFFRDYDVHRVLKRSGIQKESLGEGNEWYKTDVETVIKAIEAVEEGRSTIDINRDKEKRNTIIFRPEQIHAINQTKKVFKNKKRMLWNAKMRFGKTLSALQVIKENKFKKTLIITHRPVVSDGWFDDFYKIFNKEDNYTIGSKERGERINYLKKLSTPFIYFASLQDLRGLSAFGGKYTTENQEVANVEWDFIIIDEAHEGTRTEIAKNVLDVIGKKAKILELSGTPFNILDDYDENQVFTWDYVMEQEAKYNWEIDNPDDPNPYEMLPKMNMYTFELQEKFTDKAFVNIEDKAFNFMEFFRTKDNGKFVYENKIIAFLDEITKDNSKNNYPYSNDRFRNNLRHTLWLLPSVASCKALKELMDTHSTFREYAIINIVDDGVADDRESGASESDLERVRTFITDKPYKTKTITLTVRKLTTGVNIPEWTGIVFLNNTNSPSSYLQAAFRAQTPFSNKEMGMKTNAYIFDFAPDRALTIMTDAAKLNSGVGKKTTPVQKEQMQKFLNFLPILGEKGNGMAVYNVDSLLTKLKTVYAEKAVRTGFEDESLYNDELLTLSDVDLKDFKDLRAIIGSTNNSRMPKQIDVNMQGLTDEEYEKAEKAKKKKKSERSPEELEALKKFKEAKKQRRTMISILRGISIRIPLMIYGMEVDVQDEVDINKFVDEVDEVSWNEFMPDKVTKKMFKRYAKYYDNEVFIEAGRIIRTKAKSYDTLDYTERTEKLAQLFSTFKNPDKETVLTPWRVVNMQLGETIGGLCYFDDDYKYSVLNGKNIIRWKDKDVTEDVYRNDTKILEINSKTGLYPLFVANSLFYKKRNELNNERAGSFDKFDEEKIIQDILVNNIFVLAKTKMAKTITQRTLAGYNNWKTNIHFIEHLTSLLRKNINDATKIIKGEFDNMKFDVIIGNPPYSEKDGGAGSSSTPLYNYFVETSKKFKPKYMSFIIPTRWYVGGKGLDSFRDEMLSDTHIRELHDWLNPSEVFPNTNIRGGVCYFLRDANYDNKTNNVRIVTYENNKKLNASVRPIKTGDLDILIREEKSVNILKKVSLDKQLTDFNSLMSVVSSRKPFGLGGTFVKDKKFHLKINKLNNPIKCYGKRVVGYLERGDVVSKGEWIDKWKVFTARANNVGTELSDDNFNTIIGEPNTVCTETYLVIGADLELNGNSATNLSKYLQTKFSRYLHSLAKASQDATKNTYRFIPLQDFDSNKDIDWSKSSHEIDLQLYKKYRLDDDEIAFIEMRIKEM
ncbi:Eco57I restriction-modification methylase domain-containing protein [Vagococcus lutrae]|uniref:Eco57I restriction-modification methylase domain-containing protein n=1 Tax=Vagococcus lutrae TaxID=81947 RepID=UPI00288F53AD|nr:Eco57I restriction-modification methylase domain-containing protein [Vagococcus lutrae]MDT2817540.1 Eco57I restriction-modification methylase domain-containing protein [Vagococcus lutrae]